MNWNNEFSQRVILNASKAVVKQLGTSEDYSLLQPVYALNLINDVGFDAGPRRVLPRLCHRERGTQRPHDRGLALRVRRIAKIQAADHQGKEDGCTLATIPH